jgi:hypothetical protein
MKIILGLIGLIILWYFLALCIWLEFEIEAIEKARELLDYSKQINQKLLKHIKFVCAIIPLLVMISSLLICIYIF